jgi:hypothetical protein
MFHFELQALEELGKKGNKIFNLLQIFVATP